MTPRLWIVRPSAFPFGVSVTQLGKVVAVDRRAAQLEAERLYGCGVIVEPVIEAMTTVRRAPRRR